MQRGVRYDDVAGVAARAARIHLTQYVRRTADEDVRRRTAALSHASVLGRLHQYHRAGITRRVERLPLTVLNYAATRRARRLCNTHIHLHYLAHTAVGFAQPKVGL